jgi:hypothetical protein
LHHYWFLQPAHKQLAVRNVCSDSSNAIRLTLSAARFIPRVYSNVQAAARAALTDRLAQSANTRMSANGAGYESQGQAKRVAPGYYQVNTIKA